MAARRARAPSLKPGDIAAVHRAARLWKAGAIYYSPHGRGLGDFRYHRRSDVELPAGAHPGRVIPENGAIKRKYRRDFALGVLPHETWGEHAVVGLASYIASYPRDGAE